MDPQLKNWLIGGACVAVVLGITIFAARQSGHGNRHPQQAWKPPTRTEIARLEEIATMSGGGVVCMVMLILHQIGVAIAWAATNGAIQEATVGTLWIGGNVLWGIGIIVGRTRTYRVTREDEPREPPVA